MIVDHLLEGDEQVALQFWHLQEGEIAGIVGIGALHVAQDEPKVGVLFFFHQIYYFDSCLQLYLIEL